MKETLTERMRHAAAHVELYDQEWEAQQLRDGASEIERLRMLIDSAPVAIMDTRDVLGICAPTEADFPALYAIQGRRVRLVLDDETPNAI